MTQEEKELLLKDLCARLPYGVKIQYNGWDYDRDCEYTTVEELVGLDDRFIYTLWRGERNEHSIQEPLSIGDYKPYLRPMSSMTEEENKRYDDILTKMYYHEKSTIGDISDYLNSIHVDYRGLIPKGLAIAVNEGNNPYKE